MFNRRVVETSSPQYNLLMTLLKKKKEKNVGGPLETTHMQTEKCSNKASHFSICLFISHKMYQDVKNRGDLCLPLLGFCVDLNT